MPTVIRSLRLLAIVLWVGGIAFFAFVLAPVAFHLLPSAHEAGIVVGGTLRVLHVVGLVCGLVFCGATAWLFRKSEAGLKRGFEAQMVLAAVMLAATAYLQANVLPAMERDRAQAGGAIEIAPLTNPARMHFERLHKRSEQVEGGIFFCGLGIVLLLARESLPAGRGR
jgi:uncharacterized membrane protein